MRAKMSKGLSKLYRKTKRSIHGKNFSKRNAMSKYKTRRAYSNRPDKQYSKAHRLKGRPGRGRYVYARNQ